MLTMLAAVTEMECDLIVGRTQAGLARAKAQGKVLSRPAKKTPQQRKSMVDAYEQKASVSTLARLYGTSRTTVPTVVKLSPTWVL